MTHTGEFRLGFLPLTDAAPLIVADRLGLFAAEGLNVVLEQEASWATLRDRLTAGLVDGAHMLSQVVVAARLGLGGFQADLIAPLALNVNGAGVTLSAALLEEVGDAPVSAAPLAGLMARRGRPLIFGVVFPYSTHTYLLRTWLDQCGIDPERDVQLKVAPPSAMVERMQAGELDGFCVGAPWNALAEVRRLGRTVVRSGALDFAGPDKVFAVGEDWATRNGEALLAMLRAMKAAALWCDAAANREALVALLSEPGAVGADPSAILRDLTLPSATERLLFAEGGVCRPDSTHPGRILAQMQRWGQAATELSPAALTAVYRPDLFDQANGLPSP